jgi:ABC-type bacteriocin/lantibiotic exporter with double-glycine peptidase domain
MTTMSVVIDSIMLILGTLVLFAFGSSLVIIAIISVVLSTIVSWIFAKQYKRKIKEKARIDA